MPATTDPDRNYGLSIVETCPLRLGSNVVLSGKRLEAVADLLAEGQLKSVAALPERFAELNPTKPFVAKIEIKPVREQAEA